MTPLVSKSMGSVARGIFIQDGRPFKFRIQPGLNVELNSRLVQGIIANGGQVIPKIPVDGIVVIDPCSRRGRAILREWAWAERPNRRFVSYAFILLCVEERRLIPMDEHVIVPRKRLDGSMKRRDRLSESAQEELVLYLAKALPHRSSGNRSANEIHKRFVKDKARCPWVEAHSWQTFRNHYCKNKRLIDKLIRLVVKEKERKRPALRRQFLVPKNKDASGLLAAYRKENASKATVLAEPKKVKFDTITTFERKRRFGDDITNTRRKSIKSSRTLDDLLRAPIPPILAGRSQSKKLLAEIQPRVLASDIEDIEDVEVGRAKLSSIIMPDFIAEENHKPIRTVFAERMNVDKNVKRDLSNSQLLDLSLASHCLDLDDLRSAAALDELRMLDRDADSEDERSVAELLGHPNAEAGTSSIPSVFNRNRTRISPEDQKKEQSSLEALSEEARFTLEEVREKHLIFSNNLEITRDFFVHCRKLVDCHFVQYKMQSNIDSKHHHQTRPDPFFPAANTRARKAARDSEYKNNRQSRKEDG